MVIKLTGLAHHKAAEIAESLVPGNVAFIIREDNPKGSNGIAYRCECKGHLIGYVPELATLRKYYREATSEDERNRIKAWGECVKACRNQFAIDFDNNGQERWKSRVSGLLYYNNGQWIEFDEYSALCQEGKADGWALRQIAVCVDGVEPF